jgi:hypothetical protein
MVARVGPRFALEAGFLILVAVVAGLAKFDIAAIVLVMALAWALVATVEWALSREAARAGAPGYRVVPPVDASLAAAPPAELVETHTDGEATQVARAGEPWPGERRAAPEPLVAPEPEAEEPAPVEPSAVEEGVPEPEAAPPVETAAAPEAAPSPIEEAPVPAEPEPVTPAAALDRLEVVAPHSGAEPPSAGAEVSPEPLEVPAEAEPPAEAPAAEAEPEPEPPPPVPLFPERPEGMKAPEPEPEERPRPSLVAVPPPEPEAEPQPPPTEEAPPATAERVVEFPRVGPQRWNLWELERLARERTGEDPLRDEEWGYLLVYLREFANPDGLLPPDFDSLVRESFADLIAQPATR